MMVHCGFTDVSSNNDHLGVKKYYDGLSTFIKTCQTPMAISVEGDWGSGKTTALKIIEDNISKKQCKVLWFRTWQYANLGMDDNLTQILLTNLYEQIKGEASIEDKKFTPWRMFRKPISLMIDKEFGGEASDTAKKIYDILFNLEEKMSNVSKQIEETKNDIQNSINRYVEDTNNDTKRFVIFVDDLDRLQPKVAVELLEGIKNFLDCENCVFVLAVDSSVIYQGVEAKYELKRGDEKAKQFFDKIIQVPFHLPVKQYDIDEYLNSFLTKDEGTDNASYIEKYKIVCKTYLRNNPRAIKRAFNLLELNKLIKSDIFEDSKEKNNLIELYVFVVVVLQMVKDIHDNTSDTTPYEAMFDRANAGIDTIQGILGEEEYAKLKYVFEEYDKKPDDKDNDKEMKADLFACILIKNGVEKESVVYQDSVISSFVEGLLDDSYKKDVIGDNRIDYMLPDSNTKVCSLRKNDHGNINFVIYCKDGLELKNPSEYNMNNCKAYRKDDKPNINVRYLYSKKLITIVGITESTDETALRHFLETYNIITS